MIVTQPTHMTVAEYCAAMHRNEIIVNKKYQRSDQVWPEIARSFLIESILLGFPIPKIYLHSTTDLKSRQTIKEIVDGQQRSRTIFDFFYDKFPLSKHLETDDLRGLTYSELPESWQSRFISYSISIDLFLSAATDEVVQVFRRMNSYTVPLNPEELRNAVYQGTFKWFIYELSGTYSTNLHNIGVFGEKSLVRMQDLKLYTEIAHALDHGITTTNKKALDQIYKKYDREFGSEEDFHERMSFAFDNIISMKYIKGTNLAKPYMIYSLALAIIDSKYSIPNLEPEDIAVDFSSIALERRLLELSAALDVDEEDAKSSPFQTFISASRDRTNVKAQRETRAQWFIKALSGAKPR
ncbi:MAG TPA: DUF262 domain-containing protein [Alphaproteobacteria bacterium]|nr:DUF262 domain-containing protein [Alphaproteobacteria bacterium]